MDDHLQDLTEKLYTHIQAEQLEDVRSFLGENEFHISKVIRATIHDRTLLQHSCVSSLSVLQEILGVLGPKHHARQELTRICNDVSALHAAAAAGRLDVLRMLLEQRFVRVEDFIDTIAQGITIEESAVQSGHQQLAEFITEITASKSSHSEEEQGQEDMSTEEQEIQADMNANKVNERTTPSKQAETLPSHQVCDTTNIKTKTMPGKMRTLGQTLLRILHLKSNKKENALPVGKMFEKGMKKLNKKCKGGSALLGVLAYIDFNYSISEKYLRGDLNEISLNNILKFADKYAFVQYQEGSVRIIKEVQEELISKQVDNSSLSQALSMLQRNMQDNSFLIFEANLFPHAISIWNHAKKNQELVTKFTNIPVHILSDFYNNVKLEYAISFATENIGIMQECVPLSVEILNLQRILAMILHDCGRYKEAMNSLNIVVAKFEDKFPENDACLLAFHSKAKVQVTLGNSDPTIYENIITKMRARFGEENGVTLRCQLDNASIVLEQDVDSALEMFTKLCAEHMNAFGANDRRTLESKKCLAQALFCKEKYEESFKIYEEIEEKFTLILGEEHSITLQILQNKADVMLKLNNFDAASRAYQEVLTSLEKQLGSLSPKTLQAKLKLAKCIQLSEQVYDEYPKPEDLYRDILNKDYIDKLDPDILLDLEIRTEAMIGIESDDTEIIEAYERLINMIIDIFDDKHPLCLRKKEKLAIYFESKKRYDDAETMYHHILESCEHTIGEKHSFSLHILEKLGDVLVEQLKLEEALIAYSHLLHLNSSEDNITTLLLKQKRGYVKHKMAKINVHEACLELRDVLVKMNEILGEKHSVTLSLNKYLEIASQ